MMVAIVQVITRASEFSLAKPARETLYARVDREWRYEAGAAIDTVIYRGGDLTFVWVRKLLSSFGSSVVLSAGLLVASCFTSALGGCCARQPRCRPSALITSRKSRPANERPWFLARLARTGQLRR